MWVGGRWRGGVKSGILGNRLGRGRVRSRRRLLSGLLGGNGDRLKRVLRGQILSCRFGLAP